MGQFQKLLTLVLLVACAVAFPCHALSAQIEQADWWSYVLWNRVDLHLNQSFNAIEQSTIKDSGSWIGEFWHDGILVSRGCISKGLGRPDIVEPFDVKENRSARTPDYRNEAPVKEIGESVFKIGEHDLNCWLTNGFRIPPEWVALAETYQYWTKLSGKRTLKPRYPLYERSVTEGYGRSDNRIDVIPPEGEISRVSPHNMIGDAYLTSLSDVGSGVIGGVNSTIRADYYDLFGAYRHHAASKKKRRKK